MGVTDMNRKRMKNILNFKLLITKRKDENFENVDFDLEFFFQIDFRDQRTPIQHKVFQR